MHSLLFCETSNIVQITLCDQAQIFHKKTVAKQKQMWYTHNISMLYKI